MKKTIRLIAINIGVFIALIILLEGGARLFFGSSDVKAIFNDATLRTRERPFVEPRENRGFALKSGFKNALYSVNSDGFRGEEFPASLADKRVILAIGESTTFGWGVNEQQTYPYFLQQRFNHANEPVLVINAGTPSYSSSQVFAYLKEIITDNKIKPDTVLINILWNDIWYSTIKNWHADILIYQKPPAIFKFLSDYSRLFHVLTMGKESQNLVDVPNQAALLKYRQNLEEMIQFSQQAGIKVMFVQPPIDADHMSDQGINDFHIRYTKDFFIKTAKQYIAQMDDLAKQYDVPVISHSLDIQNLHQHALFLDHLHPTAEGNLIMAEEVFLQMQALPGLSR